MKNNVLFVLCFLLCIIFSSVANATPFVINIDARSYGATSWGNSTLDVFFEAGNYQTTLINPSINSAANYTAWRPSTSWWTVEYVVKDESGNILPHLSWITAGSAQAAFDLAVSVSISPFELLTDQILSFYVGDCCLNDNAGGVSLLFEKISNINTPVPEPSTYLLLTSGMLGLVWYRRKQAKA